MIKSRLFFFAFALGCLFLNAQECSETLFGQVRDLHDNLPLSNAKVVLVETNQHLLTDEKGRFVFTGLCQQAYTVAIAHPDCKLLERKINWPFVSVKKIYLEHHINELDEIVVTDQKQKQSTRVGNEALLKKEVLARYKSQNLGDALAEITGVRKQKTGNAIVKPVIQGFSGTRIAIVQEGIRLQDHEWGADHAPSIDLNGIEQIQVIKGANALRYGGDIVGGVVAIQPARMKPNDSLFGSLSTGYHQQGKGAFLLAEVTKTAHSGMFYGANFSLKNSGDLQAPNYVLSNTGNNEQHGKFFFGRNTFSKQWRVQYQFFRKETGILSAAHLGTTGDLARAIEANQPLIVLPWSRRINNPRQLTQHQNINLKYEQIKSDSRWDLQYNFQTNNRQEYDIRRGDANLRPALDLRLMTNDIQFNFTQKPSFAVQLKSGLSAQLQDNYSDPTTGVRRLIPDYIRFRSGVYFIGEYAPSNTIAAEIGLRYDYDHIDAKKYYKTSDWNARGYDIDFVQTIIAMGNAGNYLTEQKKNYNNFSASAGMQISLEKWGDLKWTSAFTSRSPNPAELFSDGLHHALSTIERGDLRLRQEKAFKTVVSLEKVAAKWNYVVSAHHTRFTDFIQLVPTEKGLDQTRNSAYLERQYTQLPQAAFTGVDVDLNVQLKPQLHYASSLSYLHAEADGSPMIDLPPLRISNALLFTSKKHPAFRLKIQNEYVAQQTRYPNVNFNYAFIEEGQLNERTIDISTPPEAYSLWGLEASHQLSKRFFLSLTIDNIANTSYRDYLNRLRFFSAETGRNVRLSANYTF